MVSILWRLKSRTIKQTVHFRMTRIMMTHCSMIFNINDFLIMHRLLCLSVPTIWLWHYLEFGLRLRQRGNVRGLTSYTCIIRVTMEHNHARYERLFIILKQIAHCFSLAVAIFSNLLIAFQRRFRHFCYRPFHWSGNANEYSCITKLPRVYIYVMNSLGTEDVWNHECLKLKNAYLSSILVGILQLAAGFIFRYLAENTLF